MNCQDYSIVQKMICFNYFILPKNLIEIRSELNVFWIKNYLSFQISCAFEIEIEIVSS
jgi:uncharacterized protein YcsI (UPF0317 family)